MIKPYFLFASMVFTSIGLVTAPPGLSGEYANLADDLGDASVSVLSRLGYDCQTASVGIICKKCQVEDNREKCDAYLCDAVTKKCRKKSVEVPKIPG
ncbi:MAG: hypothetical protein AAGE96_21680, partial [Cyanobacteria bacterium P01_G01_bin.19]